WIRHVEIARDRFADGIFARFVAWELLKQLDGFSRQFKSLVVITFDSVHPVLRTTRRSALNQVPRRSRMTAGLLQDVRQFMCEQTAGAPGLRSVFIGAEDDIAPDRIGPCLDGVGRVRGRAVEM